MPVWHELSKTWRETHDLALVGIAQEQHADRCALYARWQQLDWPILWDPFNLTQARAVPNVYALDEAGVVRAIQPDPRSFVQTFLERDFGAEAAGAPNASDPGGGTGNDPGASAAGGDASTGPDAPRADPAPAARPQLVELGEPDLPADARPRWQALSDVLLDPAQRMGALDRAVETLGAHLAEVPDDAHARFQLGVALRLRSEGITGRPGDFQAALDAWGAALAQRPNEYIWRRRIQQYGPTLDKPYPFYPWVEEARAALVARGEQPPSLSATLSEAERALPRRAFAASEDQEPDPSGALLRDDGSWLTVETAVAPDTGGRSEVVRVHLTFQPRVDRAVHWNNEAGPMLVWLDPPEGWSLDRRLVTLPVDPATPVSLERRSVDVELRRPAGSSGTLTGYALFFACEDLRGACTYLRRDVSLELSLELAGD